MANGSPPTKGLVNQELDQAASRPYTNREYAKRLAWEWVQRLLIRPSPRRAYRWRLFWLRLFGATAPATARTRPTTRVMHPWLLTLGEHASLGDHVFAYNLGPLRIGDHTLVSQDVNLCGGTHDYTISNLPLIRSEITIGSGVWVCAEAFIGPGVTIHDNALVAARSVVVKDVPVNAIVAGNPARVVKQRVIRSA